MLLRRHVIVLLAAVCAAGCSARTPPTPKPPPVDLSAADALFDAGCYRCLAEAFDAYTAAMAMPAAPTRTRERAFVAAVLLAVREKELGLEARPWLERAGALAAPDDQLFVEIATAIPWTTVGLARDFEPPSPLGASTRARWIDALAPGPPPESPPDQAADPPVPPAARARRHPLLSDYLLIALSCSTGQQRLDPDANRRIDVTPPIIRYRLGLCALRDRPLLETVLADDPRFAEAAFFIGRYEMTAGVTPTGAAAPARAWLTTAVPPLSTAFDAFPKAPVVATVLAGLMRSRGDLTRALELYDHALSVRPSQRDALLGRVITLTYLSRPDEAIAAATRMIELGTWYLAQAYYWRAWNRHATGGLEAARLDVEAAKKLQVNDDVLLLSGMVAFDQMRPRDARADFNATLAINRDKCPAHWYLGLLDVDEQQWREAAGRFSVAAGCYQAEADVLRVESTQLPDDLPEAARAQQMASYQTSIQNSVRQAGRSLFNAAQAWLRVGDREQALDYARLAAEYDDMREKAGAIVRSLSP